MKIRHFGLPAKPLLGADGAAQTEGAGKTTTLSKDGDVLLQGGALHFPRSGEAMTKKAKVERATVLLETLRADEGAGFGGKVKGGVDVAASLKSYFRSLEVADIAGEHGGGEAVQKFLEELDVPADIRPLLSMAVDGSEVGRPLGNRRDFENDGNNNRWWAEWTAGNKNVHTVSDESLRRFFTQWGAGKDVNGFMNYGDAEFKLGALKFYARAQELGCGLQGHNVVAWVPHLPQTPAAAAVLRRFVKAFGLDPNSIVLGGKPLPQWGAINAPRAQGSPLGADASYVGNPRQWQKQVARGAINTTQVDDNTIRAIAQQGYLADPHGTIYNAPAQLKAGMVMVFARAWELGCPNVARDINQFNNVGAHLPGSAENAKAYQRLARAGGFAGQPLNVAGQPIAHWLGMKAAGSTAGGAQSSPGRALGKVATWENDGSYNQVYDAAKTQPMQARAITDATLTKWFGVWGPNKEITAYYSDGNADSRLGYALWWARAKEINLGATCSSNAMQQFANGMAQTAEAANALRRLGRAFGFDVEHLLLAGATAVSTYPRARAGGDQPLELPKRSALGDTRLSAAQLAKAVEEKDGKLGTADDATIKRLLEAHPDLTVLMTASNDRTWQLSLLDVMERGVALGVVDGAMVQRALQGVSNRNLDDETLAERMATLAVRAGLTGASVPLANGKTLATHPASKPHVKKLERVLLGVDAELVPRRAASVGDAGDLSAAEKIGDLPGPHSNFWNQRDPRMFQISDAGIQNEMMGWGDFNSWLPHWNQQPGLLSLVARIAELNNIAGNPNSGAANNTRAWLANPVPEHFGTADALPRVLRLARAANIDPANVTVMRGGQAVPLLEHPELAALMKGSQADQDARAQALHEDIGLLSPNVKAHAAEREGAALRLLGVTDPEHEIVHNLDELLPAVLQQLQAGELARLDLSKVPVKHRDKLLDTAFQRDDHPALVALLAGALFSTDAAAIEALLLRKGQIPSVAKEMGEVAGRLMTASARELAYVSLGAGRNPPELASLGWRVWLMTDPTPAQVLARLKKGDVDAETFCAAVLERAVAAPAAQRDPLLGAVQKAIATELVNKDALIAGLSDEVKQRLDATAVERAETAVTAFLDASPAQVAAAKAALTAALGTATWLDDPNIVAAAALNAALTHDLKHVAPLGEVDEAAAGIAGKPWQSRLQGLQQKTVAVGGIQVPVEGNAPDGAGLVLPFTDAGAGKKNLQQLATRWLARRPVSVIGPDAKQLIDAIAGATGAHVRHVTVTPATAAHELLSAGGAVALALAAGDVVHLDLDGAAWPDGLGAALMAAAPKARLIATGPALPGVPALSLAPIDAPAVLAHLAALGVPEDGGAAQQVAQVFVALRNDARTGALAGVHEGSFSLGLLDRIAARLNAAGGAEVDAPAVLYRALVDVLARRTPAEARDAALAHITAAAPPPADAGEPLIAIDGKVAVIDEVRLAVIGAPADVAKLPALTSGEHAQLRCAAQALELGEPVITDRDIAERTGTFYGALTGRDVHVHLLHNASKPEEIIGAGIKDVVVVVQDFHTAPEATQDALWQAAAEGRIRLVIGDSTGTISADAVIIRADPLSEDESGERLKLRARALGLPPAVAEGVLQFKASLDLLVQNGELQPLVDLNNAADLEAALELCAQLSGAMPTVDAFVAAMSACWPMTTPEQQERLEQLARSVADA